MAGALRMAALSLRHSKTALGAYYRRIARRIAGDVAVFATASKLATIITAYSGGDSRILTKVRKPMNGGTEESHQKPERKGQELGYQLIQSA